MAPVTISVGIDVAKDWLDIAEWPGNTAWREPNDEPSIAALVERLRQREPAVVVLEATGGLECPLVAALAAAQLPVVVVNPRQVRDFARATGRLAKTDAIDAQVLAQFGEAVEPQPRPLPDQATQELAALVTRRRQLVQMLTAEKNRLRIAARPVRREDAVIDWSLPAVEVWRRVRAYNPWPAAATTVDSAPLRILEAWPLDEEPYELPGTVLPLPAGARAPAGAGFAVRCGQGVLAVVRAQRAGKRAITGDELLRGWRDLLGKRLPS